MRRSSAAAEATSAIRPAMAKSSRYWFFFLPGKTAQQRYKSFHPVGYRLMRSGPSITTRSSDECLDAVMLD